MIPAGGLASGDDPVASIADWARRTPEALAVDGRQRLTWREWEARIDHAARGLRALGQDRVALRSADRLTLATGALGALKAGLTGVLVPTRWPSSLATEALRAAGVSLAMSDEPLAGIESVASEPGSGGRAEANTVGEGALAVFTSGSTGEPRAAVLSAASLGVSARGVAEWGGLGRGDRWLLDLPVAHVGGLGVVMRCALAGAVLVLPEEGQSTAEALSALRPTHASLVSTQLRRLLASGADASSLRALLLGGSALPADLLAEAVARGLPVAPSYGLTEMGSTVTAVSLQSDADALSTSGLPLAGRAVWLRDGEIIVGGDTLFAGFLTPDGLQPPPDSGYPTGDLGRFDARGRLIVEGRRGLQFVSGGENIQPETIERALLGLPGVAEAVVVPVPSREYGQRPVAWVRLASGEQPDSESIRTDLRVRLPGFMVPDRILAWTGAAGMKPDRQGLTRLAREASGAGG